MHRNLKRTIDASLILAACAAPLVMGGRYAVGRFVFVSLAAVAAVCCAVHFLQHPAKKWRHTPAQWLIVAAALVVVLQLVPLPLSIVDWAHPTLGEHLPLWAGDAETTGAITLWNRVSLYPHATLVGLATLAAYAAVFLVAAQRLETLQSVERMIRWIAIGAIGMAAIGLLQYLAGNGKFLWIYEHPFRNASRAATGGFDNNNHFAHYMALGAGPLLWWLVSTLRPKTGERRDSTWHRSGSEATGKHPLLDLPYVPLIGLGMLLFAGLLSTSRGGALVMLLALATCGAMLFRSGHLRGRIAAALAVAGVITGAALTVHGYHRVSRGLDDFTTGSIEELDNHGVRRAIWTANLNAISEHLALGSGVGTHRYLIPIYLERNFPTEFSHAESGYLQVLTETGLAGGGLLAATLALCGWWSWKCLRLAPSSRHAAISAAVVSGFVASVVHSVWDFPWYIPGTMAVTCLLAACLCRLASLTEGSLERSPQPARERMEFRWISLAATASIGVWVVATCLRPAWASPHWDNYLRRSVAVQAEQRSMRVDAELSPDEQYAREVLSTDMMIADLEQAARHNPADSRVHLRLASQLLVRYEYALRDAPNEMPINQLRDAAVASGFSDTDELHAWVERAVGSHAKSYLDRALYHVRQAHQETPLEPEGYLYLVDLAFLEDAAPEVATAYLDQARRTDPHDGDVLIRAGTDAYLQRDFETATRLWQAAYDVGPEYQRKMVLLLAGKVPAALFLETFQPDLEALAHMESRYSHLQMPQELVIVRRYAAPRVVAAAREAESTSPKDAARLWLRALGLYRRLEQNPAAAACGRRAVALDPLDFSARHKVARVLKDAGDYVGAEKHLQWCVNHKPDDQRLRRELQQAMAGRMRTASAETAGQ